MGFSSLEVFPMAGSTRLVPFLLLACTLPVSAQVSVRVPGVSVDVGPGVVVRAPFVTVVVPPKAPPVGIPYAPPTPTVPPVVVPADPGAPPVPAPEARFVPHPPGVTLPLPRQSDNLSLPLPPPPAPPGVALRPPTPEEFADNFKPFKPGIYEVVFLHPHTRVPVKVCFDLPVCPKRVRACNDRIDFRWGLLKGVSLIFEKNGTVRIKKC